MSSLPKPPSGPLAPLPPAPSPSDSDSPLSRPGPLPLGNPQDQAEYLRLIRENATKAALEGAEGKRHPDAPAPLPGPAFDGDKNPQTGEIGGPKGSEPTRYS